MQATDVAQIESLSARSAVRFDLETETNKDYCRIWTACRQEEVVCYVLLWLVADEVQIVDVFTVEIERRQGWARKVLEAVFVTYRTEGFRQVLLEVSSGNRAARALYTSLGFEVGRVRTAYYSNGDDALELTLSFGGQR